MDFPAALMVFHKEGGNFREVTSLPFTSVPAKKILSLIPLLSWQKGRKRKGPFLSSRFLAARLCGRWSEGKIKVPKGHFCSR